MSHVNWHSQVKMVLCAAALLCSHVMYGSDNIPPRGNLARAKQSIGAAQSMVQRLVDRIQRGGDGPGQSCSQISSRDLCSKTQGCRWVIQRDVGRCVEAGPSVIGSPQLSASLADDLDSMATEDEEVVENDHAAGWALQGLGSGLFNLGQLVDQMNATYCTPSFFGYWTQACNKTRLLIQGAQGGRVAANLPLQGLIRPYDFDPIEQEVYAVRSQLWCP